MSMWWIFVAFILGGYAGAIVVGLMSMAARQDNDGVAERDRRRALGEPQRRRGHGIPVHIRM